MDGGRVPPMSTPFNITDDVNILALATLNSVRLFSALVMEITCNITTRNTALAASCTAGRQGGILITLE